MYLLLLFPQLTACRNKGSGVCGSDQGRQTNMPDVCPSNSEGTGSHCHNQGRQTVNQQIEITLVHILPRKIENEVVSTGNNNFNIWKSKK